MVYRIDYAPSAVRAIEHLEKPIQKRILKKIETLASVPRPQTATKLSGYDAYRIRIGDYRVIYAVEDERLVVLVVDVGHRREVYRRL